MGSTDDAGRPEGEVLPELRPLPDGPLNPVAIQRIIDEVRVQKEGGVVRGYNRVYHRHNR